MIWVDDSGILLVQLPNLLVCIDLHFGDVHAPKAASDSPSGVGGCKPT